MPDTPEARESADPISLSKGAGGLVAGARTRLDDPAVRHARALLEACDVAVAERDFPSATGIDPRDAPRATLPASTPRSAAADWAESGAMALTGPADGPPRFAAGPLATAARGAAIALRAVSGGARFAHLDGSALLGERAAVFGLTRDGPRSAGGAARLIPARDDTLAINLPREADWQLMPAWLGEEFGAARYLEANSAPRSPEHERAWSALAERIAARTADALVPRGRLMGLAVARATRAPHSSHRRETAAGSESPPSDFTRHHETQTAPPPEGRTARPRVLDLTSLWAGPLATSLLAEAGCDVLKIEHPERPDGARNGPREFFDLLNAGKRGCALDLRAARDRNVFESLLESADIVIESARPRALAQLGYDAASWVTATPGRIWLSITGYGRAHEWIAFGDDAAIDAGLAWSPDPSQPDPSFCADAIADPLAGLHAAVIALAHHGRGLGGVLDVSLAGLARRCAALPCETLTLPIEDLGPDQPDAQRYWLIDDDHRRPIARPRARPRTGPAPALSAPRDPGGPGWIERPC